MKSNSKKPAKSSGRKKVTQRIQPADVRPAVRVPGKRSPGRTDKLECGERTRIPLSPDRSSMGCMLPQGGDSVTIIEVTRDVGFGNTIFIRGAGDGLSWDQGFPMECIGSSSWIWAAHKSAGEIVFRLMLNDDTAFSTTVLSAPAGERTRVVPHFR